MTEQTMPPTGSEDNLPIVHVREGTVWANSRDVAAFFGKDHKNVLRDIGGVLKSEQTPSGWFVERQDVNPQNGQPYPSFDMTCQGFTLLVMGYTGAKAMGFKIRYIRRFDEMEAALKNADPLGDKLENPAWLRMALLDYTDKVIALQADLDEAKPKVAAYERIAQGSDGAMCITNAAKHLQMRPKDLFAWLSHRKWIYKRVGSSRWIAYQDKIQAGYMEHKVTEVTRSDGSGKVVEQVLMTAKGVARLAHVFGADLVTE